MPPTMHFDSRGYCLQMLDRICAYYAFEAHGANFRREVTAGVTTFLTMSYIIVVNPAILKTAGIPPGPSMVATILTAIFGTLIMVGLLMLAPITKIDFEDYTEFIPACVVVVLMSFTYNIGIGITGGFVLYPFLKLVTGRYREIRPGLWVLGLLSLLFFIFYPYS